MIVNLENVLLFIEPFDDKSIIPVDDVYTQFMAEKLNQAKENKSIGVVFNKNGYFEHDLMTKGHHTCVCGERNLPYDFEIVKGYYTNSLAEHYLKYHRSEVPINELKKLDKLMSIQ